MCNDVQQRSLNYVIIIIVVLWKQLRISNGILMTKNVLHVTSIPSILKQLQTL